MDLPDITIKPQPLYKLVYGTTKSWLLITAIEFNLFDLTVEYKTADEISAKLNTHKANTALFLNALCAIDLLEKKDWAYRNTELSDTFLVREKQCYLGRFLTLAETWNFSSREQMKERIKKGPISQAATEGDLQDMFAPHVNDMKNYARSGISQLMAGQISRLPGFAGMKKMLELGGAHGMDTIAATQKSPNLQGIVFDTPGVIKTTRNIIAEYGMQERISVMEGDYTTDPIGSGYDLIYAKATLSFFKDDLDSIFTKIHDALNPGGIFVSVHDGLTCQGTQPADMVISWLPTGLCFRDMTLDRDVIPDAMLRVGFKTIKVTPLDFPLGDSMDMCVGQKA